MSDNEKVTVKLTNGNEVTEMDCPEGVCILVACGDVVHDFGVVDMVTKGALLSAALIELPDEVFNGVIEFIKQERSERNPYSSTDNVISFRRSERE